MSNADNGLIIALAIATPMFLGMLGSWRVNKAREAYALDADYNKYDKWQMKDMLMVGLVAGGFLTLGMLIFLAIVYWGIYLR